MLCLTCYKTLAALVMVVFSSASHATIVLEENGYSNIVVAISEDINQPIDNGLAMITLIKGVLNETSALLYEATNQKVYFKDVSILIPRTWNRRLAATTTEAYYQNSDIRITTSDESFTSALPYTLHSGKCRVAGNHLTFPIDYLTDPDQPVTVKAKAMLRHWAQYRYGVFEEHGYSGDHLLPYFYRHPEGYDALSSSNDTTVEGSLLSLSGSTCEVDDNGTIQDPDNCRFVPSNTGQLATTSIMSFYGVNSVTGFSTEDTHDRRPPHRQNRLCNSMSSFQIISESPDLINTLPKPDLDTSPRFRLVKNTMLPVLYLAIDTSQPSNPDNAGLRGLNILKGGLQRLFAVLESYPDIYVAWSTFENTDLGIDSYLNEELEPTQFKDAKTTLNELTNNLTFSPDVVTRDVSAVVRDAELRLRKYRDTGGSILYVITSTEASTSDSVNEASLAEKFIANNIKLMVAESGLGEQSLVRFSVLSKASYYFKEKWDTTAFFTPIKLEIDALCKTGLKHERRVVKSFDYAIDQYTLWDGSFFIDETIGTNTTIVIESIANVSFTGVVTSPSGDTYVFDSDPTATNWNDFNSNISINWLRLNDFASVGQWNYSIAYDTSACEDECATDPRLHLHISSSVREDLVQLPVFRPWVSLTAGANSVDLSQHPAIIQARFEYMGGWIGDLTVTADVMSDKSVAASITLTDTGTIDSDISNDGIYSGIFYPQEDGAYTVNYYARAVGSVDGPSNKLSSSPCCGSSVFTSTLQYFETTNLESIEFQVTNSLLATQKSPPFVSDLQANTYGVDQEMVYVQLTWTVPLNTQSQKVRYSEDYSQLLDNFDSAPEALVVFGSLEEVDPGSIISVYVATPYNEGMNVYFIVETTGNGQSGRSHIVWTEPYPPDNAFTTPFPTSPHAPLSSTDPTSTPLSSTDPTSIPLSSTDPTSTSDPPAIETTSTTYQSSTSTEPMSTAPTNSTEITNENSSSTSTSTMTSTSTTQDTSSTTTSTITSTLSSTRSSSTSTPSSSNGSESTDTVTSSTTKPPVDPDVPAAKGFIIGAIVIALVLIGLFIGFVLYKKKYTGRSKVKVDPGLANPESGSKKGRVPSPLLNPPPTVLPVNPSTVKVETESASAQPDVRVGENMESKKNS